MDPDARVITPQGTVPLEEQESAEDGIALLVGQFGIAERTLHNAKSFLGFSKGFSTLLVLPEKTPGY